MNNAFTILLLSFFLVIGCKTSTTDQEFLAKYSGRYIYTEDETIKVHSKDNDLLIDWRGANNIKPMKVGDDTYYVKHMNTKIQFLVNPEDNKAYLVFVPKDKNTPLEFKYVKVDADYKTPSQYFTDGEYDNALEGYLNIQKKDSMNPIIDEWRINRKGYNYLDEKDFKSALAYFKINIALHPNSSNVYDSYAEGLLRSGDTVNAIANYQKVLSMDSGDRHAKRQLKRLQKTED